MHTGGILKKTWPKVDKWQFLHNFMYSRVLGIADNDFHIK